jgi:sugar phosphate isomerase/epimerase
VAAIRHLARFYKDSGLQLNMETGQETPIALLRVIHDVGEDNLGLNFDPANLLMYGKANPLDALDMVGAYVNGVHVKDGEYPTDGMRLGEEKPLGRGRVNIPAFIHKLIEIKYDGPLTIEREISGDEQKTDVLAANRMLHSILDCGI